MLVPRAAGEIKGYGRRDARVGVDQALVHLLHVALRLAILGELLQHELLRRILDDPQRAIGLGRNGHLVGVHRPGRRFQGVAEMSADLGEFTGSVFKTLDLAKGRLRRRALAPSRLEPAAMEGKV
ncbi:hypothetical protein ACFY4C_38175 [Actinomadura viridis]|uniref:hypothetical protein n=1 Tax=Actinomadura viridis TaxID=58110 RepID=UPI0036864FCF